VSALLAHESQHVSTMGISEDDEGAGVGAFERQVLDQLAAHGALAGLACGEAFHLLDEL